MKMLILAICLLPSILLADVTNTLVVVSTTAQLQTLQLANAIDNHRRTNGLAPYLAPTNSLNLRAFAESIAADAIADRAVTYIVQDEALFLDSIRRATPTQRINARQQLPP